MGAAAGRSRPRCAARALVILALHLFPAAAQARPEGPPAPVREALLALLATGIVGGLDAEVLDGGAPEAPFDPAAHLIWRVADVNLDGRDDIFLLVRWPPIMGNNPFMQGGLMVRAGRGGWRLGCEIQASAKPGRPLVAVLASRSQGWRDFTTQGLRPRPIRHRWHRRGGRTTCEAEVWEERP